MPLGLSHHPYASSDPSNRQPFTHEAERKPSLVARLVSLLLTRDRETAHMLAVNAELDARLREADFGGVHRDRRTPIFERYPLGLQILLKRDYLETAGQTCTILLGESRERAIENGRGTDSYFQADIELVHADTLLSASRVHIAFDDNELQQRAEIFARCCYRISVGDSTKALQLASEYARKQGILPPEPAEAGPTTTTCLNRLSSKRWWLRAMRRTYARRAEELLRARGCVHDGAGLYISDAALQFVIDRSAAGFRMLERALATNDLGQSFSLAELSARSVSNPLIRRTELMVRVRGLENYIKRLGYAAGLFVLTLASRFHCRTKEGHPVSSFDGSMPREGHRRLNRQWRRMRAWLHRKGIQYYGLRTVEPHHDGTPHWNVLVFCEPGDMDTISDGFEKYFLLADTPDEPGARDHRVKRTLIDPTKGDATSYIAKYISKNIDGVGVGEDLEDTRRRRGAAETCIRAETWARIHGIRQFQFFGGPAVGIWRELRRLGRASLGIIEDARLAAEAADWGSYVLVMVGTGEVRGVGPIRLRKVCAGVVGMYGDPIGPEVVGVESDELVEITRVRRWFIDWCPNRDVRQGFSRSSLPWSPVNNCTEGRGESHGCRGNRPCESDETSVVLRRAQPQRTLGVSEAGGDSWRRGAEP